MNNFLVGVEIFLHDRFTGGLQSMAQAVTGMTSHMRGVNASLGRFSQIQSQFSNIKSVGDTMMSGGLAAMKAVLDPAKEYNHQLNLMNMAGLRHLDIQQNIKAAWDTAAKVQTSTPTQNLHALGDLRTIFGRDPKSMDEARALLPKFEKAQAILDASSNELRHGKSGHDIVFSMAKAIEMMGKIRDPEQFNHQIEMMTREMVATGGRIGPEQYQQMLKFAPAGKMLFNDEFLYKVAPELMLENLTKNGGGANRVGTQATALLRMGIQGIMSKVTATNLADLGLLKDPTLKTTTTGTTVLKSGGVVGKELMGENPSEWVNSVLMPALKSHFPSIAKDEKALAMKALSVLKMPGLASGFILESFNKRRQFEKHGKAFDAIPGMEDLFKVGQQDPDQAFKRFEQSMETLKISVGQHLLPVITPAITSFALAINQLGQFFQGNKLAGQLAVASMIGVTLTGALISVGAVVAGTALALTACGVAIAPFAAGVAMLVMGITQVTLAIMNWDKITAFATNVWNHMKVALMVAMDVVPGLRDKVISITTTIRGWTQSFPELIGKMNSFWNSLVGWLRIALALVQQLTNIPVFNFAGMMKKWDEASGSKNLDGKFDEATKKPDWSAVAVKGGAASIYNDHKKIDLHFSGYGKPDLDIEKIKQELFKALDDKSRQAAMAQKSAGGLHTSKAHSGAH